MEDGWSGEWLSYSEGGYWRPIKEKDIPDWVWDLLDDYNDGDGEDEDDGGEEEDDDWDDGEDDDDEGWDGEGEDEDDDIVFPDQGHEHDGKTWYNWTEVVDGEEVIVIQFCDKDEDSAGTTSPCTENYYRDGTFWKMDMVVQDPEDVHPFLHDIVNGNYKPSGEGSYK